MTRYVLVGVLVLAYGVTRADDAETRRQNRWRDSAEW